MSGLLCTIFNDPEVVRVSSSPPLTLPRKMVDLSFGMGISRNHVEVVPVSVGDYFVIPGAVGVDLSSPHYLYINVDNNQVCKLSFTTTPQTITFVSQSIGKGRNVYYTCENSSNGTINQCSFTGLADGSVILNVVFTAFGNSFNKTFRIVAGAI